MGERDTFQSGAGYEGAAKQRASANAPEASAAAHRAARVKGGSVSGARRRAPPSPPLRKRSGRSQSAARRGAKQRGAYSETRCFIMPGARSEAKRIARSDIALFW